MPTTQNQSNEAFARALYAGLARQDGNLAVSPASVESCVLLALAGARGATASEIAHALHLSQADAQDVGRRLDRIRAGLQDGNNGNAKLTIANSAWVQEGFDVHAAYRKLLETNHRATLESVDFAGASEAARATINAWVDRATNHKISQLFASGSLDTSTRLVLANAIYFKGKWSRPFDKDATQNQPFHRPAEADLTVPLMHQMARFRYLETAAHQATELLYRDSPYAMVVWLPRKVDGLPELERELAGEGIGTSLAKLKPAKVNLFLPRFRVASNLGLGEALAGLGMKTAFTQAADFSGISDERLWISSVVHQALVEVDETGTEAAAATGAVAATAALIDEPPPKLFRADHPFLFAIRHAQTGEVLFVGRVVSPEK